MKAASKVLLRLVALLLAATMLVGMAACGAKDPAADTPPTNEVNEIVPEETQGEDPADQPEKEDPTGSEEKPEASKDTTVTSPEQTASESEKKPEQESDTEKKPEETPEQDTPSTQTPSGNKQNQGSYAPKGEYKKGIVLVKHDGALDVSAYTKYGFKCAERLYTGSNWYSVELNDAETTEQTVSQLVADGCFEQVDYDYVMNSGDYAEVTDNPDFSKQKGLDTHGVKKFWDHSNGNKKDPGGNPDVIIAVIDTGVDYNHVDLRNNIWINAAEIPDNGKDDDGNGYVDDVYGWDCVGNDNDPMDDNGHGTHVAGIIAAENNKEGIVGVAFNCRVMAIKAGNSSGYFNNSDIAEAVQYAYMNGASVINMSFGGNFISIAVEEALQNAYNTCILVAAAGNDGKCNNLSCQMCDNVGVSYPAALPYVIGVMSCSSEGKTLSSFSNYDHYPYNDVEYEVYGCGESIPSTWPGNKYATLNGTSMAAPMISGLAALLRSALPDRNVYSTKYIQSQIVNTGTQFAYNAVLQRTDTAHSVADVYEALTNVPKPAVNLYDYSINDDVALSSNNNGNGVIDAGETVRLSVSLHNRGGVATNVNVTADVIRGEGVVDPYFTFVNDSIALSDIGTYSVRESGNEKYFEIIVSPDCPNDYLTVFNIRFTYQNGLDESDKTVYTDDGEQVAIFNISSGYHLPAVINEDTVYPADRLYIVGENVLIATGVTVTFEEGAQIQFYDDSEYYNSPRIQVYGTLNLQGSDKNMISVFPSERYPNFGGLVENYGTLNIDHVNARNFFPTDKGSAAVSQITSSKIYADGSGTAENIYHYKQGDIVGIYDGFNGSIDSIKDSYFECTAYGFDLNVKEISGSFIRMHITNHNSLHCSGAFTGNIFYSDRNTGFGPETNTFSSVVENNLFLTSNDEDILTLQTLSFAQKGLVKNNTFSAGYRNHASQVIVGYLDSNGNATVDVNGTCSDVSLLYPHIVSVELFNADGEAVNTIGKEEITVRVTFSQPMDQSKAPSVTFGTIEPYADYKIEGAYTSETVWEGNYTLKAQIENGQNYLKVKGAYAANDATKAVLGEYQMHEFTIDTTAAMAMNLIANATDSGIELTWAQDDYDTLMGYNIYRSTAKDGNFVKINPSVLTAQESSFLDTNAEPGVTYWYTFTVVLSDFTESAPAGKVFCTAVDTLNPTVYHTPVNQGYLSNNLVISCTASDNMRVASVTLYYRTYGAETWETLAMQKVNDKYSATIFGSYLSLEGLEYYLVASDGSNTVSKATAEDPYFVVIKDASAISRIGDVDGNGTVTTKDALMIMQCLQGDLIMTDDEFKRADLNGDGVLSSVEALRILQYINGNVPDLNM